MARAVKAGIAYFAIVFAAGFLLGTLRVLVLAPRLGEQSAVLAEMPVILAISWVACGWIVRRFGVPAILAARLTMGGVAFALLMGAEIGASVLAFGRTLAEHFAAYRTAPSRLGLAGQAAFALFPAIQSWAPR